MLRSHGTLFSSKRTLGTCVAERRFRLSLAPRKPTLRCRHFCTDTCGPFSDKRSSLTSSTTETLGPEVTLGAPRVATALIVVNVDSIKTWTALRHLGRVVRRRARAPSLIIIVACAPRPRLTSTLNFEPGRNQSADNRRTQNTPGSSQMRTAAHWQGKCPDQKGDRIGNRNAARK